MTERVFYLPGMLGVPLQTKLFLCVDDERLRSSFIDFRYEIAGAAGAVAGLLTIPQRDQSYAVVAARG